MFKSKSRVVHTMTLWFPDAKWIPLPCCLADNTDFLLYNGVHCPCREHYRAFVQAISVLHARIEQRKVPNSERK